MEAYVLGFAISLDGESVALIKKNKPDWQKDKFNGIGGKVEEGETFAFAMAREFKEETGVSTDATLWDHFATIRADGYVVQCYRIFTNDVFSVQTMEAEEVQVINVGVALTITPILRSLRTLLPMAVDEEFMYCEINHRG